MNKRELNNLIIEIQSGNEKAFEEFYKITNKSVFTFVYSFVKRKDIAEDLTQDTYIKVKRFIFSYKQNTNASAWLLQIAKNITLDYLKKYKSETNFDVSEIDIPSDKNSSPELRLYLHDLMNKYLSEEERQIILLHDVHGYKNREISKFLNIPLGTILWKYNKAIKVLRKKYEEGLNEK